MNPTDKRVRRTRKLLGEALVSVTLEKGYDEVTIQEITKRAGIGYRTFFRHYADKDELLGDVLQTTMVEIRQLMAFPSPEMLDAADPVLISVENGCVLFDHVQENSELYRVLLSSGSAALEPVMAFACREVQQIIGEVQTSPIPLEILANHVVAAIFALIRWWLEHEMPYPPERMGVYLAGLLVWPTGRAIDEENPQLP